MPGLKANMTNKAKQGEKAKTGGGGAEGKAARTSGSPMVTCTVCKTPVSAKYPKAMIMTHVEKHAKATLEQCFPDYVEPK